MARSERARASARLGYAVLLGASPLALVAALAPTNEYRATLGIEGPDCDPPVVILTLAIPLLAMYAVAAVRHLRGPGRGRRVVAIACMGLCAALLPNIGRAIGDEYLNQTRYRLTCA